MNFRSNAICYYGLLREHVVRIFRIWPQSFIPSIVNTLLYFIIFGQVLGHRIGMVSGVDYMSYIAPGIILMAVIQNAYINVSSTFYMHRWIHTVDEVIASPTPDVVLLLGYISGGAVRALVIAFLMSCVALFFMNGHGIHLWDCFVCCMLCSLFFGLAAFINGMFARSFDDTSIVPTFVLVPLSYLGGTFYDIHQLPPFWYRLSLINPIHYLINMFRYSFIGVSPAGFSFIHSALIVCLLTAALFIVCYRLLVSGRGLKT